MRISFILLFVLNTLLLYSQEHTAIADLMKKLEQAQNDSIKTEILCEIAWQYRDFKPDSTILYAERAEKWAKEIKSINLEIKARAFKGVGYRNKGEYETALLLFNQNFETAKKYKLKERIAYSLLNSGNINLMQNNYLSAVDKILEAINIAEDIKDTTILGYGYINLARTYEQSEDYDKALKAHLKALNFRKTQNNSHDIAVSEYETGLCYFNLNQPDKALFYYNLSLEKFKANYSITSIGQVCQAIGKVYMSNKNYKKAEFHLLNALSYMKIASYKAGISEILNNLCEMDFEQKKYETALKYAFESFKISKELKIPKQAMISTKYIYYIYEINGNIEKAYEYYKIHDTYKIETEKSKYIREFTKVTMEFEYQKEKEKEQLLRDKRLAEERKEKEKQRIIKNAFIVSFFILFVFFLYIFYNLKLIKTKNIALTRRNVEIKKHRQEIAMQSEILAEANNEIITTSENLRKQNQLLETTNKNITLLSKIGQDITSCLNIKDIFDATYNGLDQLVDTSIFSIGLYNKTANRIDFFGTQEKGIQLPFHYLRAKTRNSLASLCLNEQMPIIIRNIDEDYKKYINSDNIITLRKKSKSLIYIPLTIKNKQIGILTVQSFSENAYTNSHLEIIQNIGVNTAIALENANSYKVIKRKNEEINGAVRYARKLQYSILPLKEDIDMSLQNYIIYKPKDIVSGDFYWHKIIRQKNKLITFIAVADCTGHGIPGALMSGIGIGILNETVNNNKKLETHEILEYLNFEVKNVLKQEQTKNNDGMDICLCKFERYNTGETVLSFSGAKRPLIYFSKQENKLSLIKGNLKTIGSNYVQELKFTKTEIKLYEDDMVWLTTDGFTDQNNSKRKKIGTYGLINFLEKIATRSLNEQENRLNSMLNEHMKFVEQRDDITVIGIRI